VNDRLDGWKAIAVYLRRSVRTAQRWERELGLPVHRMHADGGEIVYASGSEIEAWLQNRGSHPAPERTAPPPGLAQPAFFLSQSDLPHASPALLTVPREAGALLWMAGAGLVAIGAVIGYLAARL
jgi:hypothetical protein